MFYFLCDYYWFLWCQISIKKSLRRNKWKLLRKIVSFSLDLKMRRGTSQDLSASFLPRRAPSWVKSSQRGRLHDSVLQDISRTTRGVIGWRRAWEPSRTVPGDLRGRGNRAEQSSGLAWVPTLPGMRVLPAPPRCGQAPGQSQSLGKGDEPEHKAPLLPPAPLTSNAFSGCFCYFLFIKV